MKVGIGQDSHRFNETKGEKKLILGGVELRINFLWKQIVMEMWSYMR